MIDFNNSKSQAPLKIEHEPPQVDGQNPIDGFVSKMAEFGLNPGAIIQDGKLHRFDTDKKKNKAGWYVFHDGDICGAGFGDWKTGLSEKWCSIDVGVLTYAQRTEYKAAQEKIRVARKAEEKRNHQKAKEKAQKIWDKSEPVKDHPYLENKGVVSHYLKISENGDLIVPGLDEKKNIWSLQFIKPSGKKKFQPFGRRKGLFFEIPGSHQIFICEGYSTGASVHAATGATVVCSFTAGNLPQVAQTIRGIYPNNSITIAADNDQFTMGNPGVTKAMEAGKKINALVAFPTFADKDTKPTDFNDLVALEGLAAVTMQLKETGKRRTIPPLTSINTSLIGRLKSRPENRQYILKIGNDNFLPSAVVGVVAATGGTGKTYFLLCLANAMASGGSVGPIHAPRALEILVVCGEDDQDELDRRLWDICKGKFPKKLHAASVYGEVGPLMELDGNTPRRAKGFDWLEDTIKGHPGLEVLIIDPKSRFYGLDENNNDHATQWIQSLEYLSKEYTITILFTHHTSEATAGKISQTMSRGASAIVDGCRWQAGMAQMDKATADRYSIDDYRNYVAFDVPKSNYAARQGGPLYFKRGVNGVLEFIKLENSRAKSMADLLFELLDEDPIKYSIRDLRQEKLGADICKDMKENFSSFQRSKDMPDIIKHMIKNDMVKEVGIETGKTIKLVLETITK